MFNKLVIRQKNIIFSKFIAYSLSIIFLLWLLPLLNEDLDKSIERFTQAKNSYDESTIKLQAITETEDKVIKINKQYQQLAAISPNKQCEERLNLMDSIQNLNKRLDINTQIDTFISSSMIGTSLPKPEMVYVNTYDLKAGFATVNFLDFLTVTREIDKHLPKYSYIYSLEAKEAEVINPEIISKLSPGKKPNLIFNEIKITLKEIAVNK